MSPAILVLRGVLLAAAVAALVYWLEGAKDGASRVFVALAVGVVTGLTGALAMRAADRRGAARQAGAARVNQ